MDRNEVGVVHGCSYANLFYTDADREELYEILFDFLEGRDYRHFVKKYVSDQDPSNPQIDYKRLFTPSTYNLRYLIKEFMDHVKVLKKLRGLKTPLTKEEETRLNNFYKINNWEDMFKSIVKNRRIFGDEYILVDQIMTSDFGAMPKLTRMPSENIEIVRNPKDISKIEYIYKVERDNLVRLEGSLDTKTETEIVTILFSEGVVLPYIDGELDKDKVKYLPKGAENQNPIIHFQYSKSDNSDYSDIPGLDFVDSILRMHRIETDIAETNSKSGSPQLWFIDGVVDLKSTFGARGIGYADTTMAAAIRGNQCQVKQFEITNGLESLNTEQDTTLNGLFSNFNLVSPAMRLILAKSDSSKVIRYLSSDLIEELRDVYEEIAEKTKIIWKMLFPNRKDEDITLEIPADLSSSGLADKATFINGNVLTIREMLREQGRSPEEIQRFMDELNEQIQVFSGNGLSVVPILSNTYSSTGEKIETDIEDLKREKTDVEGIASNEAPLATNGQAK